MLGEFAARARTLSAVHLDTTLFLRRGDRFVPVPLPVEAQFAPVFGIAVADADGDGDEDLFLARTSLPSGLMSRGSMRAWACGSRVTGRAVSGPWPRRIPEFVSRASSGARWRTSTGTAASIWWSGRTGRRPGCSGISGPGRGCGCAAGGAAGESGRMRTACAGRMPPGRCARSAPGTAIFPDSLVTVLAQPAAGGGILRVRWPGGAERVYRVDAGAAAVTLEAGGAVRVSEKR